MTFTREQLSDDVTLYCGDCMEVLPTLGKVDAVVTDPPYGIGENSRKVASRVQLAKPRDYGSFDWDRLPASSEQIQLIRDNSDKQIIFGGNFFHLPPSRCWLVWDKMNSGDFADCELAWTNLNKAVRLKQYLWNGMIKAFPEERLHPTQKPVAVMEWCISFLPKDAATILDPFMGSGTTGVAAVRLARKFIGIELDPKYYAIAKERILKAMHERETDMFADTYQDQLI